MKNTLILVLAIGCIVLFFVNFSGSRDESAAGEVAQVSEAGLVSVTSDQSFASTTARIKTAIEENENLGLMAEVDHTENAAGADLELAPTKLFIFGNPNAGTPLMQASRSVAIDLPQKLLVSEEGGQVLVRYNAPEYLAARHQISGQEDRFETIAGLLKTLSGSDK